MLNADPEKNCEKTPCTAPVMTSKAGVRGNCVT